MSRTLSVAIIALLTTTASVSAHQVASPPPEGLQNPVRLDATARREVVAKLTQALRDRYIFPDVGEKAAAKIEAAQASGAYDELNDAIAFSKRLSDDVNSIAHDKHMTVFSRTAPPPPPAPGMGPPPKSEYGILRADKLAGDIGYLEIVGFPPVPLFKSAFDRALAALKGSKSLIIDIRRNGGGDPGAVSYMVSHFVPVGTPINTMVIRTAGTEEFTRRPSVATATPLRMLDMPITVLTAAQTFSGGEEFAYDMQSLKRATLIGEVTKGGANPTGVIDLPHGMAATIPTGRPENPVTKTNWEGRGVIPDVRVPAAQALQIALQRANQRPVADIQTASLQRVFTPRTTPLPGSAAALRQLVAGIASGNPDYNRMGSAYSSQIRANLSKLQADLAALGSLNAVTFRELDPLGAEQYDLEFANGRRRMMFALDDDGKVFGAMMLPPPAGTTPPR